MSDLRRLILAGIGALDLARERGKETMEELIKRGEVSEDERAKFARDIADRIEGETGKIREEINKTVEKVIPKYFRSRDEKIEELSKKVDELYRKYRKMEEKD